MLQRREELLNAPIGIQIKKKKWKPYTHENIYLKVYHKYVEIKQHTL